MKTLLFLVALCLPLLFTGCSTVKTGTGTATGPSTGQLQSADQLMQAVYPSVQPIVTALMRIGIDYGSKKSGADASKIKEQINPIADKVNRGCTLAASMAGNILTPTQFCELMKCNDDTVTRVLQSLVPMYSEYYTQWKADPTNVKIFAYAKCILDGLANFSDALTKATAQ